MAGIPLPTPGAIPAFEPDTGPTYTQIFQDTIGALGSDADGFPQMFAQLTALSSAFGVELAADQAIGPVATLGGVPGILDPAPLDGTIGNYIAAGATGDAILATAASIVEPQLLTLPITPGDGSTNFLPPANATHDFGTVKLGSPPVSFQVGSYISDPFTGDTGDIPKDFTVQAPPFTEWLTYTDIHQGTQQRVDFGITMTPLAVGQFTAQFEYVQGGNRQLIILTLTVNVVP